VARFSTAARCRMHRSSRDPQVDPPPQVSSCRVLISAGARSAPPKGFIPPSSRAADRYPVRTFLPTGYEPNYPYPLARVHARSRRQRGAGPTACPAGEPAQTMCPLAFGARSWSASGRTCRGCFSWGPRRPSRHGGRGLCLPCGSNKPGGATTFTPNEFTWPACVKARRWPSGSLDLPGKGRRP